MTRPGRDAFVVVVALAVTLGAPGAGATEMSAQEVRVLAARARDDPAALERLRAVTSIDGRPADVATVLRTDDPAELDQRLATIADEVPGSGPVAAEAARSRAQEILAQRRFHPPSIPRPLRGPLKRAGDFLERIFGTLARHLPGGEATLWVVLAALFIAITTMLTLRALHRSSVRVGGAARDSQAEGVGRPEDLDRRAAAAEAAGDLASALRLVFRAGLMRLHRSGAIRWRRSITNGEVARILDSPRFLTLAGQFDAVAYGGRAPDRADLTRHRSTWEGLLHEKGAR